MKVAGKVRVKAIAGDAMLKKTAASYTGMIF